ncbi:hypothetical protein L204_100546 [Cryptococcus depauperatus]|nr:hypothetical protein L204_01522 [Cryptococcus depauperatus CBS 7855]
MAPNKNSASKSASKAAKKSKQAEKAAKKEAQAIKASTSKGKTRGNADDEEDLDAILDRIQREQEAMTLTSVITLETFPLPRTNALLLPSPSIMPSESNHLYLLFGEYFDGSRVTFYNSTLRYDVIKNEWKEYKSGNAPAPRSSAAGVCVPGMGEGGGILIFGGEYASPTQTSFHHYKDMWLFSTKSHTWDKIDNKKGPSGRSGHRMVLWKHYVVLFGGFIDVGIKTNYLSDLWIFDTEEFKWKQIEYMDKDRAPGPRSGFSFIPCPEGAILHGGYRKDYVKGTSPKGVPLDDTWLLRMDTDLTKLKWEKRKRVGYHPSLRSGCSMAYWASKGMGVLFGGVLDEERDEESMESIFYNDLYAYNPAGNGRWMSLNLKKKKAGGKRRKKVEQVVAEDDVMDIDEDGLECGKEVVQDMGDRLSFTQAQTTEEGELDLEDDADSPAKTTPLTRCNAMLAVVKNTLYIYGGIFETSQPAREYTLDDFITLNLEKLDYYVHLRGTGLDELEWKGSDDEDGIDSDSEDNNEDEGGRNDEDDDDDDDGAEMEGLDEGDDDEETKKKRHAALTQTEKDTLRQSAKAFMGISKNTTRSQTDIISTPLPGENLRLFYERSREYWAATAHSQTRSRGKDLRREGFHLCKEKYDIYKPILEEIERIQEEAELDAAAAAASKRTTGMGTVGEGGRNRR